MMRSLRYTEQFESIWREAPRLAVTMVFARYRAIPQLSCHDTLTDHWGAELVVLPLAVHLHQHSGINVV